MTSEGKGEVKNIETIEYTRHLTGLKKAFESLPPISTCRHENDHTFYERMMYFTSYMNGLIFALFGNRDFRMRNIVDYEGGLMLDFYFNYENVEEKYCMDILELMHDTAYYLRKNTSAKFFKKRPELYESCMRILCSEFVSLAKSHELFTNLKTAIITSVENAPKKSVRDMLIDLGYSYSQIDVFGEMEIIGYRGFYCKFKLNSEDICDSKDKKMHEDEPNSFTSSDTVRGSAINVIRAYIPYKIAKMELIKLRTVSKDRKDIANSKAIVNLAKRAYGKALCRYHRK